MLPTYNRIKYILLFKNGSKGISTVRKYWSEEKPKTGRANSKFYISLVDFKTLQISKPSQHC